MAENAKKQRSGKARVLTRRLNELLNGLSCLLQVEEIVDKMSNLKYTLCELGTFHDDLLTAIEEENAAPDAIETENEWYNEYDKKVNIAVRQARSYVDDLKTAETKKEKIPLKGEKVGNTELHVRPETVP